MKTLEEADHAPKTREDAMKLLEKLVREREDNIATGKLVEKVIPIEATKGSNFHVPKYSHLTFSDQESKATNTSTVIPGRNTRKTIQ